MDTGRTERDEVNNFNEFLKENGISENTFNEFLKDNGISEQELPMMRPNKVAVVRLYYNCWADYLPNKGALDYSLLGFSKLATRADEVYLLGLYQGLVKFLDCPLEDFLNAFEGRRLSDLIETKFSEVKEESRGAYYAWFKKNRSLFDGLVPAEEIEGGCSAPAPAMPSTCKICSVPTKNRCNRCRNTWYCSKEHQILDWPLHKSFVV